MNNDMQHQVFSGDKEVLVSGSVITFFPNKIELKILDLVFRFEFVRDETKKELSVKWELASDGSALVAKVINFDSKANVGPLQPVHVGHIENRKLYLIFRISSLSENDQKLFSYTFYKGEDMESGKNT